MKLSVRVIPNATVEGVTGRRSGEVLLRVRAPAVDGKANQAARRYLASLLGVPKSRVLLVAGEKSRHKKFEIVGLEAGLAGERLSGIFDAHRSENRDRSQNDPHLRSARDQ